MWGVPISPTTALIGSGQIPLPNEEEKSDKMAITVPNTKAPDAMPSTDIKQIQVPNFINFLPL